MAHGGTGTGANGAERATTVKLKINGLCVNRCSFCKFHDDPARLEVADLAVLFDNLHSRPYRIIHVNGGEPTIHPGFVAICDFLRQRFKGSVRLALGTNLVPFSFEGPRAKAVYAAALDTFDAFEVGCDDEHRNIHLVERFFPALADAGLRLKINVVTDYCGNETRQRIERLQSRLQIKVHDSALHHDYDSLPVINRLRGPCRHRTRVLMVGCNGDAFFCAQQEHEAPIFNLHTVEPDHIDALVSSYDPGGFYRFCECCDQYRPEDDQPEEIQRVNRGAPRRWAGRLRSLLR